MIVDISSYPNKSPRIYPIYWIIQAIAIEVGIRSMKEYWILCGPSTYIRVIVTEPE
jgi:hypothetical protein